MVAVQYLVISAVNHILACLWHAISSNTNDPGSWLYRYGYAEESVWDRYTASNYFVYTTFTTSGYGDIVPYSNYEYAVTIILMCSGVVFHSFLHSTMTEDLMRNERERVEIN